MTLRPDHQRSPVDYDLKREVAARLRAEMMNDIVSKGLSAVTPSRRTLPTFALAVLVAAGAFWTVMLREPPRTVEEAVPSRPAQASSR